MTIKEKADILKLRGFEEFEGDKLDALKAIRAKCMDCCCDCMVEIRNCVVPGCPLYPYRMGMRPETYNRMVVEREKTRG